MQKVLLSVAKQSRNGENMKVDSFKVVVKCLKCNAPNKISLAQFLRQETLSCVNCGVKFAVKDEEGKAKRKVEEVQHSIDELEQTLKK